MSNQSDDYHVVNEEADLIANSDDSNAAFASKFRRLRACARCHRLKMRCVFEDPTYQSCTRCFKAGILCSLTEDPTEHTARARPRKRPRIHDGPLAVLQQSLTEANRYLTGVQKELTEKSSSAETDIIAATSLSSELLSYLDFSSIQLQLSSLQKLLTHVKKLQQPPDTGSLSQNNGYGPASSANSMKDGPVKPVPSLPYIPFELNVIKELFKLGILSEVVARSKYKDFRTNMLSYWPCISLPQNYTFEWLIEHEPLSLLAFITVTCLNEPDLHDALLYYLEGSLARKTAIAGDITVNLIEIYLTLSLWCSPPRKWGSYKHQMSLMMALNISLCLDLGNEQHRNNPAVLKDSSKERNILRAYMGVYACCGSLGLSLPRFKVVSWTPAHQRCASLLLMGYSTPEDRFLCYYSRLVALGEEIFQFLCPSTFSPVSVGSDPFEMPHESLRTMMIGYERRMQQLAAESGFFSEESKERNMLSIVYYQLLMTMYDYVVCKVLLRKDLVTDVYLQTLTRLVKASEKVIQSFLGLCLQTVNFPTFFYYRPMHALVALIRARLLVKTQALDLEIDVEHEFQLVSKALKQLSQKAKVAEKMSIILTRISKWMKVSNKFNKDGATNSMVDLLNELGKEKAVENIKITVKRKEGDNANLRPDSKIRFKRFINYSPDALANIVYQDGNETETSAAIASENTNNTRSNLVSPLNSFIPSPIGFSSAYSPESNQQGKENNIQSRSESPQLAKQDHQLPTMISGMRDYPPTVGPLLDDIGGTQIGYNSVETSMQPSDSELGFQQQQNFLNDIFTQIDSDVMNLQLTNDQLDFDNAKINHQGSFSATDHGFW
ncbi:hypothetical protein FOA43_001477 [Brettanomyces nanus]|uniref:Zn(2)-C6 fungal-type domain-containing protein n=1 Tax=Eeniella nana TaxID=13502 RepID=A0A875RZR1_EENNA|nr:uncharacterized protein FOA43_001477 [Brettanomyces nanus]QPG74153.1 hypothetical protein FOA43_001477 [Brettanomyces nanus]